ncbi:MAG TPA: CpsB/CapC family capsule biosynthesis tyrosine phosphatase [Polyangiaceae bacterium]|nr:CpsB/CapC family capsule biosynthesis tyrosine phosphatase [Polyangiaceae bacterium]
MRGFVDLHCHWIAEIDDGAPDHEESLAMLRALKAAGFDRVVATPHMRPGMFENTRQDLETAYERMQPLLAEQAGLPAIGLGCEHYFDDTTYQRLLSGAGLPYPGERAVLVEFYGVDFPMVIAQRLTDLRRRGLLPVMAHPERYRHLWRNPDTLERMVDSGIATLLDTAALIGKYGREPQRCAEDLLERGLYHAACSDAHRASDVADVKKGIERVEALYGEEEVSFLFVDGPRALLEGRLPE